MDNEMEAPFAVVTGASSGIGYELARQFAEHGFDLLVTAEDDAIEEAAGKLRTLGVKVHSVRADLAEYDGVETLYEHIRSSGRPVDAIAINAGVGVGGPFVENDLDAELNLISLNVVSVVHLAKRVVRDMAERDGFEALMAGKDHVVSAMAKEEAMVAMGKVMPETVKAQQHRKLAEPGSANP
jgi:uncharacterized protein